MRNSLALCYEKKMFLYEARPDIAPYGFLSDLEMFLWEKYYATLRAPEH